MKPLDKEGLGCDGLPDHKRNEDQKAFEERAKAFFSGGRAKPLDSAEKLEASIWVAFIRHLHSGKVPKSFKYADVDSGYVIASYATIEHLQEMNSSVYKSALPFLENARSVAESVWVGYLADLAKTGRAADLSLFIKESFGESKKQFESLFAKFKNLVTENPNKKGKK